MLCDRVRSSIVPWAPTRPRTAPPAPEPPAPTPQPPKKQDPSREDPTQPAEPLTGLADARARKGLAPGQWDVDSSVLARRKTDLTQRKAFLRNFWYAAGESPSLGCMMGYLAASLHAARALSCPYSYLWTPLLKLCLRQEAKCVCWTEPDCGCSRSASSVSSHCCAKSLGLSMLCLTDCCVP